MCSQHSNTTNGGRINEFQALGSSFSYLDFVQKMMNVGQKGCKYSRLDLLLGKSILNYLSISLICEEIWLQAVKITGWPTKPRGAKACAFFRFFFLSAPIRLGILPRFLSFKILISYSSQGIAIILQVIHTFANQTSILRARKGTC